MTTEDTKITTTTEPRITLYLAPDGNWYADMSLADDAAWIDGLMGTTQVMTPFRRGSDWRMIRAEIAAKNPGHDILVDILSR